MLIKILGGGCANCDKLYANTEEAVKELGLNAEFEKVTDSIEIAKAGIMKTPALVVDDKVVFYGRVPTVETIKKYLK
ncbi:TM0996/MTH895 family glutaredoxin-like protein [Mycoplasmatota bacterium]|nr:TM0996/MTH895 family glutaredoxin-like protein [Mycoplasmatota bacterium]